MLENNVNKEFLIHTQVPWLLLLAEYSPTMSMIWKQIGIFPGVCVVCMYRMCVCNNCVLLFKVHVHTNFYRLFVGDEICDPINAETGNA